MAEINHDPSALYDADFKKKRENPDFDIEEIEDDTSEIGEESAPDFPDEDTHDVFEEKGSLFSRFKRSSKRKKKSKNNIEVEEDDYSDNGYDIFDLENLDSGEQDSTSESAAAKENIDDINALLESVGIKPITEQPESDEDIEVQDEQDEAAQGSDTDESEPADGKTKHFSLGKQNSADEAQSDSSPNAQAEEPAGETEENTAEPETAQRDDGQLILDGYADEEEPKNVPEEKIEADLKATRQNLIENFRVLAKTTNDKAILEREPTGEPGERIPDTVEISSGEDIFDAVDRAGKKKKGAGILKMGENAFKATAQRARKKKKQQEILSASALYKKVKQELKQNSLRGKIVLAIAVFSLVLSFLTAAYNPGGALEFLFGSGARVFTVINILLLAAGAVLTRDIIKDGIDSIRAFRPDGTVCVLLMTVFVAVHTIAALITGMYEGAIVLYAPCSIFGLLALVCSRHIRLTTVSRSISRLMKAGPLHGLQQVENSADAAALGHGIGDKGEPSILYSADVDMPTDFAALFEPSAKSERFYSYTGIAVLAVSFIFSLALSISTKNAQSFATFLVGCLCLCLPILRDFVLEKLRSDVNNIASADGAAVLSFEKCEAVGKANAVALDADDIFEGKISKFRLVPGGHMALSDAVVYAAATLKGTPSLIANAFDDYINEAQIKLPEAEDRQYEEKLGYACWVAGRRVLVGNRQMLVQHSIDAPTQQEEMQYSKNKSVMYVVVEGIIAATFIVTYPVIGEAKRAIRKFAGTGLVLMLNCADPCINEAYIAKRLGTEEAAIKLTGTKGAQIISDYRGNKTIRQENGLLAGKKQKNILSVVNAAHDLFFAERIVTILNIIAIIFCFAALILFIALKVTTVITVFAVVALQMLWAAAGYLLGKSRLK